MTSNTPIALVTGASSGIGEATAKRLEQAGYKVYGTSRRGAKAAQGTIRMLALDVTDNTSVAAAVSELIRLEGRIDLLVNNAGIGIAPAGAEESSIEQAQALFDTNFFGMVRMTRAVVPHMRRQGRARASTSRPRAARFTRPWARGTTPPSMRWKAGAMRCGSSCSRSASTWW